MVVMRFTLASPVSVTSSREGTMSQALFILRVGLCPVYVGWDDDDDEDYMRFQFVADLVKPTVNSEIRLGSLR